MPTYWRQRLMIKFHSLRVRFRRTFWLLSCALLPLFVVRCSRLFRRTAIAYATVIAVSLVFFTVFPVTSIQLRVPQTRLDISRFSDWAVSLLYSVDPPYNLFPSPPPLDRNSCSAFRVEGAQILWSSSFSKRGICRCVRLHTQTTLCHRCTRRARPWSGCRGANTRSLQTMGARDTSLPMACNSSVSRVSGCSLLCSLPCLPSLLVDRLKGCVHLEYQSQ